MNPEEVLARQRRAGFVANGRSDLDPAFNILAEGGDAGRTQAEAVLMDIEAWHRHASRWLRLNKWLWYE